LLISTRLERGISAQSAPIRSTLSWFSRLIYNVVVTFRPESRNGWRESELKGSSGTARAIVRAIRVDSAIADRRFMFVECSSAKV
jgi:hypothetical protein